jgi:hypothetical protein
MSEAYRTGWERAFPPKPTRTPVDQESCPHSTVNLDLYGRQWEMPPLWNCARCGKRLSL